MKRIALPLLLLLIAPLLALAGEPDQLPELPLFAHDIFAQVVIINYFTVADIALSANPGNPPTGKIRIYGDSTTGNFTCLTSTGASCVSAGGGGSSSFSSLTSGTNTNTGAFTFQQAGTFTSGQFNETHQYILNGGNALGNTCPANYNPGGASSITDAISGCAYTPSSGVTNSFTNGLAGYVQVNDPNQGGQFGKVEGVGVYGAVTCAANNTKCIGMAPSTNSKSGLSGVFLEGIELGVFPTNTTDTGFGILLTMSNGVQPAGTNLPAVVIQSPSAVGTYTDGFVCQDGSVANTHCVIMNKTLAGNTHDSQSIQFNSTNSSGTNFSVTINGTEDGALAFVSAFPTIFNPTGPEQFAISLTSTAALTQGQLVKIDTANANSVVVCTTADTQCHGFVAGNTYLCGAAGTFCEITTTPGSKAVGVLGTGTCAIGNNVIVDTTTNGRVKCQAGVPAQGAWIGIALSAQASVGGNVNILTKFQ